MRFPNASFDTIRMLLIMIHWYWKEFLYHIWYCIYPYNNDSMILGSFICLIRHSNRVDDNGSSALSLICDIEQYSYIYNKIIQIYLAILYGYMTMIHRYRRVLYVCWEIWLDRRKRFLNIGGFFLIQIACPGTYHRSGVIYTILNSVPKHIIMIIMNAGDIYWSNP